MCVPKIDLLIPGRASIADFLIAEIGEKEKKGVGIGGKNAPIIPGP
jgi:hypothetical protein